MRINHRKYAAMHPKSIAATTVLYNGAAAASAVGIPLKDANEVLVDFHLGAVSASQGAIGLSVYVSPNSTGVSGVGDLTSVADAVMALSKAIDENTIAEGIIQVKNIVPAVGKEEDPQFLYVKYTQETADAVLCECIVEMNDTITQPVALPVEGVRAVKFSV